MAELISQITLIVAVLQVAEEFFANASHTVRR